MNLPISIHNSGYATDGEMQWASSGMLADNTTGSGEGSIAGDGVCTPTTAWGDGWGAGDCDTTSPSTIERGDGTGTGQYIPDPKAIR